MQSSVARLRLGSVTKQSAPAWQPLPEQTQAVAIHPTMTLISDRPLELVMNRPNTIFNQCYFVYINGVGLWGGGPSLSVDPDGRVLQPAG